MYPSSTRTHENEGRARTRAVKEPGPISREQYKQGEVFAEKMNQLRIPDTQSRSRSPKMGLRGDSPPVESEALPYKDQSSTQSRENVRRLERRCSIEEDTLLDRKCLALQPYIDNATREGKTLDFKEREKIGDGAQGVVSLCDINGVECVYKKSLVQDFSIEHEDFVGREMRIFKSYISNCVYNLGSIDRYCQEFRTFERILFYEKLNKTSMTSMVGNEADIHMVISQTVQMLLFLYESYRTLGFTHYDIHMSNILIQPCNKNIFFLYKIENHHFLLPSYGYFPVLIDLGVSKTNSVKNMSFSMDNYNKGTRSYTKDHMEDVIRLIIPLFNDLSMRNKRLESVKRRIFKMFRNVPCFSRTGWKSLKVDVTEHIKIKIRELLQNYDDEALHKRLFNEYKYEILDLLNYNIKLPLKNVTGLKDKSTFYGNFIFFFREFCKFFLAFRNIEEHKNVYMGTLKNFVIAYKEFEERGRDSNFSEIFMSLIHRKCGGYCKNLNTGTPHSPNILLLLEYYKKILVSLNNEYCSLIQSDDRFLKEAYKFTAIKDGLDMSIYLLKNMTPGFELESSDVIHYIDCEKKKKTIVPLNRICSQQDIEKINSKSILEKADLLHRYVVKYEKI